MIFIATDTFPQNLADKIQQRSLLWIALKVRSDCYQPVARDLQIPSFENMWHKLVRYKLDVRFQRPVVHEKDNRGAQFTLNYRRVSRVKCSTPGDNEMESSSMPSLENMSLAPLITRGYFIYNNFIGYVYGQTDAKWVSAAGHGVPYGALPLLNPPNPTQGRTSITQ